jgi:hypothetical protein
MSMKFSNLRNDFSCAIAGAVLLTALQSESTWAGGLNVGDRIDDRAGTIEIVQIQSCKSSSFKSIDQIQNDSEILGFVAPMSPALSCSTKDGIKSALQVTKITTGMIAVAAACTPTGAPVAIVAGISGVVTDMIDLVVSNLDCEDPTNDYKIEKQVKSTVCSVLNKKGIECDPRKL